MKITALLLQIFLLLVVEFLDLMSLYHLYEGTRIAGTY